MNIQEPFKNLIQSRQACTTCHHDDNLCHFEKLLTDGKDSNLYSPWNPCEKNTLDAEILIVGQDFGIFQYLKEAGNTQGLINKERDNSTNKKLLKYLKSADLVDKSIYFTNAILCIKNGKSKNTKSGTSMSSKVEPEWFENCSSRFLRPLITEHLNNLKVIITLGKYALYSINHIVGHETTEPIIRLVAKPQHISISNKSYVLIPMLHPSFDHLSIKGHEKFTKATESWEYLKSIV